ncbi:MAG TPA: SMP-30/gluconolactonase/LRE family protein [Acidimicrobiia bacterium]|nr:SMP-30/gluconolactonase/LRE family protein [Acidimicrobiia bacterium]
MNVRSDLVVDSRCLLGESPYWDPATESVAWVDIDRGELHRHVPGGTPAAPMTLPTGTSFAAAGEGGRVVAVGPFGVQVLDGAAVEPVVPTWMDPDTHRTNDGAIDPDGRLWIGTMRRDRAPGSGRIGVVADGAWHPRTPGLTLPNGIGWSPDQRWLYYVDTFSYTLWRAEYDRSGADIGAPHPHFQISDGLLLDGLCVDLDGCVWVAVWGGSCVLRVDPSGREIGRVEVATQKVTSCAFGPPGSSTLYITTADPDGSGGPGAGGLYAAQVGIDGMPVATAGF